MRNLSTRIKNTRRDRHMSQAALAEASGVTQPTIANWENGSHIPRQNALKRIAQVLDVEENWLLLGPSQYQASQRYLSRPIRHIPIRNWPKVGQNFYDNPPMDFIPYPSINENAFALVGKNEFSKAILVFEPNHTKLGNDDYCLWQSGSNTRLNKFKKIPTESPIIARLMLEIKTY